MASTPAEVDARLTALESRQNALAAQLAAVQAGLSKAVSDFSPTAARVAELSAGFQAANSRLAALEATIAGMSETTDMLVRVDAMQVSLAEVTAQVNGMAATRTRSGRLGTRLQAIEDAINKLAGQTPAGGGQL
jgi:chromosome segregation ATPase